MTTHAYHQTKRQGIGNTITALLAFVLVLSNVLLPRAVYGNTPEAHEVVLSADVAENRLLTSARALDLPASNYTYAPPAQVEPLDESKSILSPAAYLIYLLDFVSRSIEPIPNRSAPALDSLASFEALFKQDFSALLASDANNDPVSYVECTNVILETLIAELDGYNTEQARPPIPQGPDLDAPGVMPSIPMEPAHDAEGANSSIPMGPAVESIETTSAATEEPTPAPTVVAANAEALDTQPGTTRFRCGSLVNPALLDAIYAQLQSIENLAITSSATPNNALGPQLFVDLFDAYVQELDTTRAQVRLVMSGTETLQNSLVDDLHLPNRAALQRINVADATITGTGYSSIVALQDLLWDVKWAEAELAIRGEQQADLRDSIYRQFRTDYRAFQQAEMTRILQELILLIDPESATFDQELTQKQTDARTCVVQGGDACPPDSAYSQNPPRMLRELLTHESQYLVPESDRSYMFPLEGSLRDLDQEAQKELLITEFFTQGISITVPIAIDVLDGNEWAVAVDTDEYRIEASDELYNVYRYCGDAASNVEQVLCLRENDLTTQRFQALQEEFPIERQRERLRKEALTYAEERLWSQDEFERQLERLAQKKYEQEFAGALPDDLQKEAETLAQQEWQASVDQAEAGYQTMLRANLLALLKLKLTDMYIRTDESFEEALADKLLLDLLMNESQVTTPLAFAISRLHTLVQGARLGSDTRYRPIGNFDESAWSILSSYGIFHAAMTVSNYPESFLFPELRPNQSSLFESARISVTQGTNVNQVHEQYPQKLDHLRHLQLDAVVPADSKIFVFARSHNIIHYYGVLSSDGQWKDWEPLPGAYSIKEYPLSYPNSIDSKSETIGYVDGYIIFFGLIASKDDEGTCNYKVAHSRLLVDEDKLSIVSSDDPIWLVSDINFNADCGMAGDFSFTVEDQKNEGNVYHVYSDEYRRPKFDGTAFRIDTQLNKLITKTTFRPSDLGASGHYPVSNSHYYLWQTDDEKVSIGNPFLDWFLNPFPVGVFDVVGAKSEKLSWGDGETGIFEWIDALYRVPSDEVGDFKLLGFYVTPMNPREIYPEPVPVHISNADSLYPKAVARIDDELFGFFVSGEEYAQALYYANLTEPEPTLLRLSLPPHPSLDFTTINDDSYALPWLEDYYLHFPIMVANYLMENQRYDEALVWLSEVYDPFTTDEENREVYPAFHPTPAASDSDADMPDTWLQDPFTPHLIADQNPSRYLWNTELTHIENLLGWADALYTMDTVESVNRARELYEVAAHVLQNRDTPEVICPLTQWTRFGTHDEQPRSLSSLVAWLKGLDPSLTTIDSDVGSLKEQNDRIASRLQVTGGHQMGTVEWLGDVSHWWEQAQIGIGNGNMLSSDQLDTLTTLLERATILVHLRNDLQNLPAENVQGVLSDLNVLINQWSGYKEQYDQLTNISITLPDLDRWLTDLAPLLYDMSTVEDELDKQLVAPVTEFLGTQEKITNLWNTDLNQWWQEVKIPLQNKRRLTDQQSQKLQTVLTQSAAHLNTLDTVVSNLPDGSVKTQILQMANELRGDWNTQEGQLATLITASQPLPDIEGWISQLQSVLTDLQSKIVDLKRESNSRSDLLQRLTEATRRLQTNSIPTSAWIEAADVNLQWNETLTPLQHEELSNFIASSDEPLQILSNGADALGNSEQTTAIDLRMQVDMLMNKWAVAKPSLEALSLAPTIWSELTVSRSNFCLPSNPLVNILRWRVDANLFKIHTNRNFAGLQRNMPFYATPLDPGALVRAGGVGTSAFNQSATAGPPPIYRYSFLLERARYLTGVAQQFENTMLSTIEKEEAETYTYMRAKQDLSLERSGVVLQDLRLDEAKDSKRLATAQRSRAETQQEHYSGLLNDMSIAALELYSLGLQAYAATLYTVAGALSGPTAFAQGIQATSSTLQMATSYEIRHKEWEFQEALAGHDITIAEIGEDLGDDRIAIVNQERNIANQRLDFATDVVEYLADEKFTNAALYRWMNQHLRQIYREQLNMAIATAKSAQRVLEFERQTSLDFIGNDYWEDEKRGLLGAEQLLQDLEKMEQYRLTTATRRKEIEKTISLASVAPAEFQRFKQTGVLEFATLPQWFERDFPGHYLRLVKDVRVNLVAIVPTTDGIHATLSNNGISRVMTGPPFEERTVIYRQPESVAISSPNNATGLFELNPNDPMLFPFEGSGVDTSWTFQMDKGANRFNYDTIYDLFFTIRYTALEDTVYRKKILEAMGQDEDGYVTTESVRFFSLANEFVDEWYGFHNPMLGFKDDEYLKPYNCDSYCDTFTKLGSKPLQPYTMVLELGQGDFPYNEEEIKVKSVTLAIQRTSEDPNASPAINFQLKLVPNLGSASEANLKFAEDETVESTTAIGNNRPRPFGRWILQLEQAPPDGDISWLKDVLLIIEYEAKVHYN